MSPPIHPWLALFALLIGAPFVWGFARFLFSTPEEDIADAARDIPGMVFDVSTAISWLKLKILALALGGAAILVFWYKTLEAILEWL